MRLIERKGKAIKRRGVDFRRGGQREESWFESKIKHERRDRQQPRLHFSDTVSLWGWEPVA